MAESVVTAEDLDKWEREAQEGGVWPVTSEVRLLRLIRAVRDGRVDIGGSDSDG